MLDDLVQNGVLQNKFVENYTCGNQQDRSHERNNQPYVLGGPTDALSYLGTQVLFRLHTSKPIGRVGTT